MRDHGAGIQPRPARSEPPALGLGLPLIAALSDAFELRGSAGQGTEVRMTFAYARDGDPARRRTRSRGTSAPTAAGTRKPTLSLALSQAAWRSAASSRMRPRRPSALDSIWRTRSGVMPSWRPISRSGVGSPPSMP